MAAASWLRVASASIPCPRTATLSHYHSVQITSRRSMPAPPGDVAHLGRSVIPKSLGLLHSSLPFVAARVRLRGAPPLAVLTEPEGGRARSGGRMQARDVRSHEPARTGPPRLNWRTVRWKPALCLSSSDP